ncbi:S-formylglutathione hydrolase FrmB [Streptomyces sp. yr375]|uniref:alpha/beta hydrolase n=1 Tax=Streptomyces sp. yr375 TaxID=1761906 RepID=UPI0008B6DBCF|nr:alpha/beta hydrolase-fold protein [Streptomyces sp. yr375]SER63911.1 S-formylglutathione hydrolase FrmB [Streptomyces sp. yr375]
MSLTGTPFLYTLIALSVVAVALPLLAWSRLRGPRILRAAGRVLMLMFAQGTAVALVFVVVNNSNGLYDTWADLLGTGTHVQQAADLGVDGTGGIALDRLPKVTQKFVPAQGPGLNAAGGVRVTDLQGRVSGVNAEVYVWLPPQYNEPAYAHRAFPVVELLPGYPGSAKSWYGTLHVHEQLAPLMRSGQVAPFILVAPRTTLLPGVDTGCANVPGTVNADTWLSIDVPRMVKDNFRVQSAPKGWAVAGYSAGGHCAAKLAVAHPDRYRAAVSLSGYSDPMIEHNSLAAQDPELRRANNPYLLLGKAAVPPPVALYLSGQPHDGYEAALALRKEAKAPTSVHVVYIPSSAGGHTMALWRPQVVPAFRWLTTQLGQQGASGGSAGGGHGKGKGKGTTPPGPSNDGSRHAALASGSASRATAERKR